MSPARRSAHVATACALAACLGAAPAGCSTRTVPACNPYFPLQAGASWSYRDLRQQAGAAIERRLAVDSDEGDAHVVTAVMSQDVQAGAGVGGDAGGTGGGRTIVRCASGAIAPSVEGTARTGSGAAARVRAELPGFPPAEKLVPGFEWRAEGRIETQGGYDRSTTTIRRESRVDGFFPVETRAGKFAQSLQVSSIETLRTGEGPKAREARQEIREWYVRGIGLVKRDTRLADASGKEQAASAEELVHFTGVRAEP